MKNLSPGVVFPQGKQFYCFAGSEVAMVLLFPMQKIFESFVAAKLRKHLGSGVSLGTQDNRYSLFDSPIRAFSIRPDLVLESGEHTVILDTKWKLLSDNVRSNGISQSDMYQMYAYSKKYDADDIVLLYSQSDSVSKGEIRYASDVNAKVDVSYIGLRNVYSSIVPI